MANIKKKRSKTYSISVTEEVHQRIKQYTRKGFSQKQAIDELMKMFERMAGALSVYHALDHDVNSEDYLNHTFFDHLLVGDYSFLWDEEKMEITQ